MPALPKQKGHAKRALKSESSFPTSITANARNTRVVFRSSEI